MQRAILVAALTVITAATVSCTSTSRIPDRVERSAESTPLHIYSRLDQVRIAAGKSQWPLAEAAGDTWLAGMLDALSRPTARKTGGVDLASMDELIADQDIDGEMLYALNAAFRKGKPFAAGNIHTSVEPIDEATEHLLDVPEPALLVVTTSYFLTPDLRALRVETDARLYVEEQLLDKRPRTSKRLRPVYRNRFVTQSEVVAASKSEAMDTWLADGGRLLMEQLRECLRESARLVALGVNHSQTVRAGGTTRSWKSVDPAKAGTAEIRGVLVEETDDRYVIRQEDGRLVSLPRKASS